jgi:hypothetical protein
MGAGEMNERTRRLAVPVAIGAAVAAGIGAVVVALGVADGTPAPAAAASQPTTTSTTSKDHDGPGWWRGGWWGGPWGGWFGDRDALHGEIVVTREGGGTETVLFQRGEVTAVSPSAITVRSTDGVTTTFTVTGDTKVNWGRDDINSVANGEQVVVSGPRSGDSQTAERVIDLTDLGHK